MMSNIRKHLLSRVISPIRISIPLLALCGMALLSIAVLDGCPAPATKCISAADCAGADMACQNGMCVKISSDGSIGTDKAADPDKAIEPDKTVEPDKAIEPDKTTGPKEIGMTCEADTDCITGAQCRDPGGLGVKVCTNQCTVNTNCGQHFCDKHQGVKLGLCLPKCTTSGDCGAPMDYCTSEGHCWKKGGTGALCNDAGECAASNAKCVDPGGLGPKICTNECTSDADCGSDGLCDQHPGVVKRYCLPKCAGSTDCNKLLHMDLCTQEKHCWRKGNAGSLCYQKNECQDGFDCADPGGLGPQICHKECSSDADCNVDGVQSKCGDPGSGKKICLPACTGSAECESFSYMPNCNNGQCWK